MLDLNGFLGRLIGLNRARAGKHRPAARRRTRLGVEVLEDRMVPAQLTVVTPLDPPISTAGTLRYAIQQANTDAARGISDTIVFDAAQMGTSKITLQQGYLELKAGTGTVSVDGGNTIAISGNRANTIFVVDPGAHAFLNGLTLQDGVASVITHGWVPLKDGGAIFNSGSLTLSNSSLINNVAVEGGGLYNLSGAVTISASTITANSSSSSGGGIYNYAGNMTVVNSTITGNGAGACGGGICNTDGKLTVSNATIALNSALQAGGGIYSQAQVGAPQLRLMSTIVALDTSNTAMPRNLLYNDPRSDVVGAVTSDSAYNLIMVDSGLSGIFNGSNHNVIGHYYGWWNASGGIGVGLAPLDSYGGPTQTMALTSSMPFPLGSNLTSVVGIVSPSTTTIGVANVSSIASTSGRYLIKIDGEQMLVTDVNAATNTLTVQRGYNGTTPVNHSANAPVCLATDQRGSNRSSPPTMGAYQSHPATSFEVNVPSTVSTGAPISIVVIAKDAQGNTVPDYSGPIDIGGPSLQVLTGTLVNGTATIVTTLTQTGMFQFLATQYPIVGVSNIIKVTSAAAASFTVSVPNGNPVVGSPFNVSITAVDAFGNVATGYSGKVSLSCSDGQQIPSSVTLSNGVGTVSLVLYKANYYTHISTSAGSLGNSPSTGYVNVVPGTTVSLAVTAPPSVNAYDTFSYTVTAKDVYGNLTSPAGLSVQITGNVKPVSSQGVYTNSFSIFNWMIFDRACTPKIVVSFGSITAASDTIVVKPAAVAVIAMVSPRSATAGTAFSVTVTAKDRLGHTVLDYDPSSFGGLKCSDGQIAYVAGQSWQNGVGTMSVTLNHAGAITFYAVNQSVVSPANPIVVTAGAVAKVTCGIPLNAKINTLVPVTITTTDAFGNPSSVNHGTFRLSTSASPSQSVIINNFNNNGVDVEQVVFPSSGTYTCTVDNGSLRATSNNILVTGSTPPPVIKPTINVERVTILGVDTTVRVWGSGYLPGETVTVTWTSSGGQATFGFTADVQGNFDSQYPFGDHIRKSVVDIGVPNSPFGTVKYTFKAVGESSQRESGTTTISP